MDIKNKKILFQGDSITDMGRGSNEWDQNHLYGHGYVYQLAAKLNFERPNGNIKIVNRGITSETSIDMYARWQKDAIDIKPDIISILIGINDIHKLAQNGDTTVEKYGKTMCKLIEETKEKLPDVEFVILEPFSFTDVVLEKFRNTYANEISKFQKKAKEIAEKYGCIFVELQEEFENKYKAYPHLGRDYWIWDGIHPTAQGHRIIAEKWLKCVEEL